MSSSGRVADVLLNPLFDFEKYSCYFMPVELFKHKPKLLKYSKLEETDLLDVLYTTLKNITLVNESQIHPDVWHQADLLTKAVDSNDISFVALSIHLGATLWTLDQNLSKHLQEAGFHSVVNTQGLIQLLS